MLRLGLGEPPLNYELAVKSVPILLKNAQVYFRAAAALAKRNGNADDEVKEAEVKEFTASALAGDTHMLLDLISLQPDAVRSIVEEMKDDGLLCGNSLRIVEELWFSSCAKNPRNEQMS